LVAGAILYLTEIGVGGDGSTIRLSNRETKKSATDVIIHDPPTPSPTMMVGKPLLKNAQKPDLPVIGWYHTRVGTY